MIFIMFGARSIADGGASGVSKERMAGSAHAAHTPLRHPSSHLHLTPRNRP
jgi:hypothetical protein